MDVSPDGTTVLFDSLGDLFTVPIGGGVATRILGGVAFDRFAKYSPDGTKVLYTSDLSGCDNLWVFDLSTKNIYQVSNESYRYVTNGMWAPNGTTVVGVKWYTSERSIGAGEIWSFPVSSVAPQMGYRLVGRPSFDNQVGPEEPVYSRDGGSVYYSKNTADPSVFQYSKDPNKGIYSIYRYDYVTSTSTLISSGGGGAARPIISNDGTHLAFVRRTLFNNSLVILNLASGNERVVYHKLDFDQQASSAPSGVYPAFTWLKGDQEILIWAKGAINRVNIQTGRATQLTLSFTHSLYLADVQRPSTNPATGSSFATKVATGASYSRTNIFFNALGRSYYKSSPTAAPQLLVPSRNTLQEFEFSVAASPSGLQAVQVVWNDVSMGYVQLITLDGSLPPITLTNEIGRYGFPAFSVQGDQVVFSRFGADTLTGPLYGLDSGIFVATLEVDKNTGLATSVAAAPVRVTRGDKATFSANGQTVLVERFGSVTEVTLSTKAERTLVTSSYATSISVSPDLAFVSFIEMYELYIAPLVLGPNGVAMELSTKPGFTPANLRRFTPNGGDYLSWPPEGSSKAIYWITAATLYSLVPADLFNCPGDVFNDFALSCAVSLTTQISLSLTVPTNIAPTSLVFDNAVLVTMTGDETTSVIPGGRIVILGDRIVNLGPVEFVPIPVGATVIDVQGGVVMPGFIDAHAHWSSSFGLWVHQSWEFMVNLAFGVTTMHNPSYDTVYGFADAELVRAGLKLGPRIFSTGTILYGAAGSYRCEIDDIDSARASLRRLKAYGAFSVKSYNQPCRAARQMIMQAARELDMAVVPEGGMAFHWNLNQIIDGHTTLEHSLPIAPVYHDVQYLFAKSGTGYTPTLIVNYGGTYGENYAYDRTNVWENERLMRFSPHRDIIARSVIRPKSEDQDYHHFQTSASANEINALGGLTLAGAHGQRQGLGFHWEMALFRNGSMSTYNVLKTATANVAEALGLNFLGKLDQGFLADIIVFPPESSPLENIDNTQKLRYVLKDGRLYDAATMNQILPSSVPLPQGPVVNIPENDD